jgi:hypothetical protein
MNEEPAPTLQSSSRSIRLSISGVVTTYITGAITTAVRRIMQRPRSATNPAASTTTGEWKLLALVWGMYLLAAIGTVAMTYISPYLALGVPIMLLAKVVMIALVWSP